MSAREGDRDADRRLFIPANPDAWEAALSRPPVFKPRLAELMKREPNHLAPTESQQAPYECTRAGCHEIAVDAHLCAEHYARTWEQ